MASITGFLTLALEGLVGDLEAGTEEGVRIGVEKLKEDEERAAEAEEEKTRVDTVRRKKREEETAFWTTTRLRPLAEPPILDWDCFFRTQIPSDLRYKALFPNDLEKRSEMKDLVGELEVLEGYTHCAALMKDDSAIDSARREFYKNLRDVVYEVRKKYQHLIPSDFVANRLATFEFEWLGWEGCTEPIRHQLRKGYDVFADWPQEVQDKYGHLQYLLLVRESINEDNEDSSEESASEGRFIEAEDSEEEDEDVSNDSHGRSGKDQESTINDPTMSRKINNIDTLEQIATDA